LGCAVASPSAPSSAIAGIARIAAAARRACERPLPVVGALVALSAGLAAFFATKITTFQPDELGYTHMAIALAGDPSLRTSEFGGSERLNQLYPLSLAPFYGLFVNVTAFALAHWWNALLMGSAVIPVYLLAREVLARRSTAYMAAAVAAVVPWLTLSSGQLTEVIAYPAGAWALFAMQRALAAPSWRADLLAIAAIAVATYGRLQLGILGPVFVAAVVLHELGWALTGGAVAGGRADALRRARRRLLRDHVVLAGATAIALVATTALVVAGGLQQAFGYYGNTLGGQLLPDGMWRNAQANLTFLAFGLGVLPVAWTVGLILESAVAARARRVHAFAILACLTLAAIVITVARVNVIFNGAEVQERYVMFVVPVLVVGLLAGLFESRRPAITLLLGAGVVAALVATTDFRVIPSSFWFLVSPGMTAYLEVIAPRLGQVADALGDPGISRFVLGGVAIVLAALLLAAGIRPGARRRKLVTSAIVASVFLFCATTTVYSFDRVVHGSAEYKGLGGSSVAGQDWIDRAVGADTPVSLLATQIGQVSDSREVWTAAEFWNRSVTAAYALSEPATTWHDGRFTEVGRDGRVVAREASRYVVVAARALSLGLVGRELARSPDGELRLVDAGGRRLRAAWTLRGVSDAGWLRLQRPATMTIAGRGTRCSIVRLELAVPRSAAESRSLHAGGGGLDRTVVVHPREARTVRLRACGPGTLRLRLAASVPATATAVGATIQLRSVSVEAA